MKRRIRPYGLASFLLLWSTVALTQPFSIGGVVEQSNAFTSLLSTPAEALWALDNAGVRPFNFGRIEKTSSHAVRLRRDEVFPTSQIDISLVEQRDGLFIYQATATWPNTPLPALTTTVSLQFKSNQVLLEVVGGIPDWAPAQLRDKAEMAFQRALLPSNIDRVRLYLSRVPEPKQQNIASHYQRRLTEQKRSISSLDPVKAPSPLATGFVLLMIGVVTHALARRRKCGQGSEFSL